MKLKRFCAFAMTTIMAASAMTACSSSSQPAEGTAAQTEAKAESGDKKEEAQGEKTVINVWSKDRHDADYVQAKVEEYNKTNTDNIEVVYTLYTDNYKQAVDMAVQNGELPDFLVNQPMVWNTYFPTGQ